MILNYKLENTGSAWQPSRILSEVIFHAKITYCRIAKIGEELKVSLTK